MPKAVFSCGSDTSAAWSSVSRPIAANRTPGRTKSDVELLPGSNRHQFLGRPKEERPLRNRRRRKTQPAQFVLRQNFELICCLHDEYITLLAGVIKLVA